MAKSSEESTCSFDAHNAYVVVNFLPQVIFVFLLFLGMVMYVKEVETKDRKSVV